MSSPAVAAALALSESRRISGRDVIVAIALANEISSRVGSVAPGQFHRRGFHPTGLFAPFGITYLAGKLLGSDADTMARGAGICGSVAAGLLECWVDGTQSKFLHSGFAAQSGITAATLAHAGVTGSADRARRPVRPVRVAPAGPGDEEGSRARDRRTGRDVGEPQRLVQAVSRGARAASVRGRRAARA